jgi:hypothetical protein
MPQGSIPRRHSIEPPDAGELQRPKEEKEEKEERVEATKNRDKFSVWFLTNR